jgi:hypothetical protein
MTLLENISTVASKAVSSAQSAISNAATTLSNTASNVLTQAGFTPAAAAISAAAKKLSGESRIPNPLHDFASYNYLFSLSVMDNETYNKALYKFGVVPNVYLARSGSRTPDKRPPTAFKGPTYGNPAGKFEFFIEDLKINHVVGFEKTSGNTNACGFSFKIIEPYSMGLFFQALQIEALAKGHKNYLDAPMLLTVEFKGHTGADDNQQMITLDKCTRHYPLKLRIADMRVTGHGCEYEMSAIPVNEQAFDVSKMELKTEVAIEGKTVKEMLADHPTRSLQMVLSTKDKDQKTSKIIAEPDQYEIIFPGENNLIGKADMGFSNYAPGNTPFASDNLTFENGIYKRGNISINPKVSEFRFAQGSDIVNAINQVVLMSAYGKTALKQISSDGFVNWWRVEIDVHFVSSDANLDKTGIQPKKYIYRVVPYTADSSYFLPPNEKRKGVEANKANVLKEYNYIYSGKNIDVLDFDIKFSAGFYTAIFADASQNSGGKQLSEKEQKDLTSEDVKAAGNATQVATGQAVIGKGTTPTRQLAAKISADTLNKGGGGYEDAASLAARQFHEAITANASMVVLDMTILGDPYYMGDSGMGNYHAEQGDSKYINDTGSMTWDKGEVHVLVNFKTPVDIDLSTGLYDFGNLYTVDQFSGLYKVTLVTSAFSKGKFTQTINLIRLPNQEAEAGTGKLAVPAEETIPSTVGADRGEGGGPSSSSRKGL